MARIEVVLLPQYAGPMPPLTPAREGDAGVDLYSTIDVVLQPGQRLPIPVGISAALPSDMEAQIRPRSGMALKGLSVVNSPGTVDSGFRGELCVLAHNVSPVVTSDFVDVLLDVLTGASDVEDLEEQFDFDTHEGTIHIRRGDRIAQVVFAKFERPEVLVVTELPSSERGTGGFGSTGV